MATCPSCGEEVDSLYDCPDGCGESFCVDCRLARDHDCNQQEADQAQQPAESEPEPDNETSPESSGQQETTAENGTTKEKRRLGGLSIGAWIAVVVLAGANFARFSQTADSVAGLSGAVIGSIVGGYALVYLVVKAIGKIR
jgi:hypothetical protein